MKEKKKISMKMVILNVLFVTLCVGILVFLLNAPEETTAHLPKDDIHGKFHEMKGKKEAEKFCLDCHDQDKEAPLPADHPPKYRCLFCHKKN